jgi:hypothetical protein
MLFHIFNKKSTNFGEFMVLLRNISTMISANLCLDARVGEISKKISLEKWIYYIIFSELIMIHHLVDVEV